MQKAMLVRDVLIFSIIGACLFLTGTLLPVLALPMMLFFSCPTLILSYERGLASSTASSLLAASILFFFLPPIFGMIYALTFGLAGAIMGLLARKIEPVGDLLILAIISSLVCKLAVTFIFFRLTGSNFLAPDAAQIEQAINAFAQSRFAGMSGGNLKMFEENIDGVVAYLIMLIPYSLIFFTTVETICCYFTASFFHKKRTGETFFRLPPFGEWSFPKNVIVALFVGFLCDLLSSRNPEMHIIKQIGANLAAISRTLFIIQGLAATYCIMTLRGFSKFIRVAIIIITPLFSILGDIFSIVGIVDLGFDLRKKLGGNNS